MKTTKKQRSIWERFGDSDKQDLCADIQECQDKLSKKPNLHKHWDIALPMFLSDLVWWLTDEAKKRYKLSPTFIKHIKYRLKNIVANVGREEVKKICAHDGVWPDDEFFDSLDK